MDGEVHVPGIGLRVISLKYVPSFEDGHCWDIRRIEDRLDIYQSDIQSNDSGTSLLGYRKLDISPIKLSHYIAALSQASFPIAPLLDNRAGLDGTDLELKFSGAFYSEVTLRWWTHWPKQWSAVIVPTFEMIETLLGKPIDRGEAV